MTNYNLEKFKEWLNSKSFTKEDYLKLEEFLNVYPKSRISPLKARLTQLEQEAQQHYQKQKNYFSFTQFFLGGCNILVN